MSSPSSYKLLSSGKEHNKMFYGLILFWVLEKLTSKHLIGVDSFKASCAWKNAGLSGEKFVFLQNFMQQSQQLHYSCPPQRVMWMPMAPLSSSFLPEKTPLHIFYKSKYKRWTLCHTLTSNIGKKCWHLPSVLRKHQMGAIQLVVPYGLGNIGGTSSSTLPSRLG